MTEKIFSRIYSLVMYLFAFLSVVIANIFSGCNGDSLVECERDFLENRNFYQETFKNVEIGYRGEIIGFSIAFSAEQNVIVIFRYEGVETASDIDFDDSFQIEEQNLVCEKLNLHKDSVELKFKQIVFDYYNHFIEGEIKMIQSNRFKDLHDLFIVCEGRGFYYIPDNLSDYAKSRISKKVEVKYLGNGWYQDVY